MATAAEPFLQLLDGRFDAAEAALRAMPEHSMAAATAAAANLIELAAEIDEQRDRVVITV